MTPLLVPTFAMLATTGMLLAAQTPDPPDRYHLGRAPTPDELRALDIDVRPDGRGLPPGRGTARDGAAVYVAKCAACHGMKGEGLSADRLVGRNPGDRFDFATTPTLLRTIGSYWPYATTLFDYTRRTMPFPEPGSLEDDEVYSLVAYLLFLNDIIGEDAVMDRETLPGVRMPARDRFVPDDRTGGPTIR